MDKTITTMETQFPIEVSTEVRPQKIWIDNIKERIGRNGYQTVQDSISKKHKVNLHKIFIS